jgi:hypothetical protein
VVWARQGQAADLLPIYTVDVAVWVAECIQQQSYLAYHIESYVTLARNKTFSVFSLSTLKRAVGNLAAPYIAA